MHSAVPSGSALVRALSSAALTAASAPQKTNLNKSSLGLLAIKPLVPNLRNVPQA